MPLSLICQYQGNEIQASGDIAVTVEGAFDNNTVSIVNNSGLDVSVFVQPGAALPNGNCGEQPAQLTPSGGSVDLPGQMASATLAFLNNTLEESAQNVCGRAPAWSLPPDTPYTQVNFVAIRFAGSLDIELNEQSDNTDPAHQGHPAINALGSYNSSSPYVTTVNRTSQNVIMYFRVFAGTDTTGADLPPITIAVNSFWVWWVNTAPPAKTWYGYAFEGQYDTSAAYFTAHPYDPAGGHHTGEIDQ
jgi:hypothetical protein